MKIRCARGETARQKGFCVRDESDILGNAEI